MNGIITITSEEYAELTKAQERIAVVERLFNKNIYVSIGDLCAVLNIEYPHERES